MKRNSKREFIFVQIMERSARKAIIKRGVKAKEYYEYCAEVDGGEVWNTLGNIKEAQFECVSFWLPDKYVKSRTSEYVMGVEVPLDHCDAIPDGFDVIELPRQKYMIFQGEPYEEKDAGKAIGGMCEAIAEFRPEVYGYRFDYETSPRFQLAPMGYRGYIEAHPVKEIKPYI